MHKRFSIELPIYSNSIEHLAEIAQAGDIDIVVYGGVPNSPLNGGRLNFSLDGFLLNDKVSLKLSKKQLSKVLTSFYETVAKVNQSRISFRYALTNMYVSPEELNDENLDPVAQLVASSQKFGVKNGLMLNNPLLEDCLRKKYGDQLIYISSCTKYVVPERILTPRETINLYLKDSGKYDFICVTPQDSRRGSLLKEVLSQSQCEVIAICNSYCSNNCNSFHHYHYMSQLNKKSLLNLGLGQVLPGAFTFLYRKRQVFRCSAFRQILGSLDINEIAEMQLEAGITNFKIGRGIGADCLDQLVSLIRNFIRKRAGK